MYLEAIGQLRPGRTAKLFRVPKTGASSSGNVAFQTRGVAHANVARTNVAHAYSTWVPKHTKLPRNIPPRRRCCHRANAATVVSGNPAIADQLGDPVTRGRIFGVSIRRSHGQGVRGSGRRSRGGAGRRQRRRRGDLDLGGTQADITAFVQVMKGMRGSVSPSPGV